jgi:hypothetical protein
MAIFAIGWLLYLAISGCIVYLKSDYFNFDKSLNLCYSRKTYGTIWWILEDLNGKAWPQIFKKKSWPIIKATWSTISGLNTSNFLQVHKIQDITWNCMNNHNTLKK